MHLDTDVVLHGVLPVSLDAHTYSDHSVTDSALQHFITSSQHASHELASSHFITKGLQANGKVKLQPYTTASDMSGYDGHSGFDLDPTNSGTYIYDSYIPSIVIVGQRPDGGQQIQLDPWWNFPTISTGSSPGSNGLPLQTDPCVGGAGQKIDWNFIGDREAGPGTNTNVMTVPKDPTTGQVLDHSGPTIAHGFDVGNHSVQDMQHMGLSATLINKLTPYAEKTAGTPFTGQAALDYVTTHQLTLSDAEVSQIDAAAHGEALSRLVGAYDSATGRQGAFWALPSEAQTVLASVSFQYGALWSSNVQNNGTLAGTFWKDMVHDNWTGALNDLRNFGDKYSSRRGLESNVLNEGIINLKLNNGSPC